MTNCANNTETFVCEGCRKNETFDELHIMRIHNMKTCLYTNVFWLCVKCAENFESDHFCITIDKGISIKRKFELKERK